MHYQVFNKPPEGFNVEKQAAGCYCEYEDKILLLKRHPEKYQGNTWGVPGGKFEEGEDARSAVIREVYEEVGLEIAGEDLTQIGTFYIRDDQIEYVFHTFRRSFSKKPLILLALEEHLEARWLTIKEAFQLPLIRGGMEALVHYNKVVLSGQREAFFNDKS